MTQLYSAIKLQYQFSSGNKFKHNCCIYLFPNVASHFQNIDFILLYVFRAKKNSRRHSNNGAYIDIM